TLYVTQNPRWLVLLPASILAEKVISKSRYDNNNRKDYADPKHNKHSLAHNFLLINDVQQG
ncbi:hypothetical protein NL99_28250, partial [Salmonella enterica]|nr:hypothetical protein [Salmonella enterica]